MLKSDFLVKHVIRLAGHTFYPYVSIFPLTISIDFWPQEHDIDYQQHLVCVSGSLLSPNARPAPVTVSTLISKKVKWKRRWTVGYRGAVDEGC